MRTDQDHINVEGESCPNCGSPDIEGGSIDTGGGRAKQEMFCLACESSWVDRYVLAGFQWLADNEGWSL